MKYLTRLFSKNSHILLALFIFLFSGNTLGAETDNVYAPFPKPDSGYVTDNADLLSASEEEELETLIWEVESRTRVEIIVMTIRSISDYPQTKAGTIEAFATGMFNKYKIGNLPENNGILLLVSLKDRKARIELGAGYDNASDTIASKVMNEVIVPEFKKRNYSDGITEGVEALVENFTYLEIGSPWYIYLTGAALIISILTGVSFLMNGKRGWGYVFLGLALILFLLLLQLLKNLYKHKPTTHSSTWSPGGLGGFGGGSSSGGGATGSW